MIYTVTFNPSLDYVVALDKLQVGSINRTKDEDLFPGGKGINVSLILQALGVPSRILGFKAGFTGDALERMLAARGCASELLPVQEGFTRINVKVRGRVETAVNGKGPAITEKDLCRLLKKLEQLKPDDILVLSGSGPAGCSPDLYREIAMLMGSQCVPCVVDAEGPLLQNALEAGPFLVKPNKEELEGLLGRNFATEQDLLAGVRELQEAGARNVLVSLGGEGALLADRYGKIHKAKAPEGEVVNTVGAGDSMVAGFLAGYVKTKDYGEALRWGVCAGSATAFSLGLATKEDIARLMEKGN